MQKNNVATFFSGGFGSIEFALKYEHINHEVVIACEYDPFEKRQFARESYLVNHGQPTDVFHEDIMTFDATKYKNKIDLAHFSPPCQDFSLAGKRKGIDGNKGILSYQPIRIIAEMRPKMFTIENVANLAKQFKGDMDFIIGELQDLGYQVSWHIMNASDYGTPQSRSRLFIVGFDGVGQSFNTPKKKKLELCIGDLLEKDVAKKYYLSSKALDGFKAKTEKQGGVGFMSKPREYHQSIRTLTARYAKQGITDPYVFDPKLKVVATVNDAQSGRVYALDGLSPVMSANGGGLGAKNGLFDTSLGIRRLTPREAARAMGDTEDMFNIEHFSDSRLYRFIGNAIDINTYRVLLMDILSHKKLIDFSKTFKSCALLKAKNIVQLDLFGDVA